MAESDNFYTLEDEIATLQAQLDNCRKANELTVEEWHKKYDARPPGVGFYRGWIPQQDCSIYEKQLQDLQGLLPPLVVTSSGESAISGGIPQPSPSVDSAEQQAEAEHQKVKDIAARASTQMNYIAADLAAAGAFCTGGALLTSPTGVGPAVFGAGAVVFFMGSAVAWWVGTNYEELSKSPPR